MDAFELDMAFAPEEVAAGLERLLGKLALTWSCERRSATHYQFLVTWPGKGQAAVAVQPLPPERLTYASLFPRTLLEAHAYDGTDLEAFRRGILLAFMRVTG